MTEEKLVKEAAENYADNCAIKGSKQHFYTSITFEHGAKSQAAKEFHTQDMYTEEEVIKLCLNSLEMGFDLNNNPLPRLNEKSGKEYWEEWFNSKKK